MRMDTYMKNIEPKVMTQDGKYLGTEDCIIRTDVATTTILAGYKKNASQPSILGDIDGLVYGMALKVKENNLPTLNMSNFHPIKLDGEDYLVAPIGPKQYVFFKPLFIKHLSTNGFKICLPYLPCSYPVYGKPAAIMKNGQVVGVLYPALISDKYMSRVDSFVNLANRIKAGTY